MHTKAWKLFTHEGLSFEGRLILGLPQSTWVGGKGEKKTNLKMIGFEVCEDSSSLAGHSPNSVFGRGLEGLMEGWGEWGTQIRRTEL